MVDDELPPDLRTELDRAWSALNAVHSSAALRRLSRVTAEPICPRPGCGAGVLRPKCSLELGADCPRLDVIKRHGGRRALHQHLRSLVKVEPQPQHSRGSGSMPLQIIAPIIHNMTQIRRPDGSISPWSAGPAIERHLNATYPDGSYVGKWFRLALVPAGRHLDIVFAETIAPTAPSRSDQTLPLRISLQLGPDTDV